MGCFPHSGISGHFAECRFTVVLQTFTVSPNEYFSKQKKVKLKSVKGSVSSRYDRCGLPEHTPKDKIEFK